MDYEEQFLVQKIKWAKDALVATERSELSQERKDNLRLRWEGFLHNTEEKLYQLRLKKLEGRHAALRQRRT